MICSLPFKRNEQNGSSALFASFGDKAEILSPDSLRQEMKLFLSQAKNATKYDKLLSYLWFILEIHIWFL